MSEDIKEAEQPAERKGPVQDPQELLKAVVESKAGGQMRSQQVEAVDAISNALKTGENLVLEAPTGSGKALAIDTPILTEAGWKTMGEVTEADRVFGTFGQLINVTEAHEAYTPDYLYLITFENDEQILADGPHLWPSHYSIDSEEDMGDILERVKADLESADALPDTLSASSLMYMLPYVPEEIKKHFKKGYDKEAQHSAPKLLEEFYLFMRNSAGSEILTTEELYERFLEVEEDSVNGPEAGFASPQVNILSLTKPIQYGSEEISPAKQMKIARKLLKAKYDGSIETETLSVESKQGILKSLLLEAGETNPNGTGYYYLGVPSEVGSAQVKQLISSLGYKTVTLTPSGRLLFQSDTNLLEGTRDSDNWMKPYHIFYNNDSMKIESIVKLENNDKIQVRCLTVDSENHLFVVGKSFIVTHNTLSYLVPAVFHGTKAVISTATKQLSEQIINLDIPFVQQIVKEHSPAHTFSAALLKGRDNYYCAAKENEQKRFEEDAGLFSAEEVTSSSGSLKGKQIASESAKILAWAKDTETGDRSEAPAVSDEVWRMFSSTSAECPGRGVCSFASQCFSEKAREKAKESDIIVTNHAVVANDLRADEAVLLGERDTYIFDEMHELDKYLSDAWGVSLTSKTLKDSVRKFSNIKGIKEETAEEYEKLGKKFNALAEKFEVGLISDAPKIFDSYMSQLYKITNLIAERANQQSTDKENNEAKKKQGAQVFKQASEIAQAALMLMNDNKEDVVRWVSETEDKKTGEKSRAFHATLLRIGPELQESLAQREANMVATSATIRVAGSFEIPVHNLDLKNAGKPYKTKELSSPFEYKKQAMIYIPDPELFPAPDYKTRDKHSEAVRNEALELINAMGGRALMLHTTKFEMNRMGEFLKTKLKGKFKVLVQGDAPNQQLIDEFKEDKTSVLVATMGMWHGLDVPGDALALVMMDKIPFTPMNDPLSKARQEWADNNGRSGFNDVYVAEANIMLAQGAGRLVRSVNDKGIIAIFDTRLRTKAYARNMTKSLPDAGYFMDKSKVIASAQRLGKTFES